MSLEFIPTLTVRLHSERGLPGFRLHTNFGLVLIPDLTYAGHMYLKAACCGDEVYRSYTLGPHCCRHCKRIFPEAWSAFDLPTGASPWEIEPLQRLIEFQGYYPLEAAILTADLLARLAEFYTDLLGKAGYGDGADVEAFMGKYGLYFCRTYSGPLT